MLVLYQSNEETSWWSYVTASAGFGYQGRTDPHPKSIPDNCFSCPRTRRWSVMDAFVKQGRLIYCLLITEINFFLPRRFNRTFFRNLRAPNIEYYCKTNFKLRALKDIKIYLKFKQRGFIIFLHTVTKHD